MPTSTITLRYLEAFTAVARLGSFTAAGHELGLSQSAISHAVSNLEASLNLTLFQPRAAGATKPALTSHGYRLLPLARAAIACAENLTTFADSLRKENQLIVIGGQRGGKSRMSELITAAKPWGQATKPRG